MGAYARRTACLARFPAREGVCDVAPRGCLCLQDRMPGPAFQPMKEGEQNLERMMGQMEVGAALPCSYWVCA